MPSDSPPSSYSSRWVAKVRGQIIAQGGTPDQALRAAQSSRHKETPEIIFMPPASPFSFSPLFDKIRAALPDVELYLVGGAVRDAMLGRLSLDLDFAAPSQGIKLARRIADFLDADIFPLDNDRDTGRVIATLPDGSREKADFATYRGASLEDDLRNRDFTVNAMAVDLQTMSLHDPLNGANDLRNKKLRACAETSISDDPIRILRGVRLAASLGFQIESGTRQMMKSAAPLLGRVSNERVRDELFKILEGPQPAASMRALDMLGALHVILPELEALKGVGQPDPHIYDVWEHTLQVLSALETIMSALAAGYDPEQTSDLFTGLLVTRLGRYRGQYAQHFANALNADRSVRGLLFFAALCHDIAKPHAKSVDENGRIRFWGHDEMGAEMAAARARALSLSNDETARLTVIIKNHMRIHFHANRKESEDKDPSRRAIYRFFKDSGAAGLDLVLLALADLRATRGNTLKQETWAAALDVCRIFLENYWERPEEVISPPRLLDGNGLMRALNLKPGPRLGDLLEAIREGQAVGKVSTREEAIEFGKKWLAENPEANTSSS
ncbi:MAG: CCA-adding enzyme [Anaerolineales bacterium]|nr:CCA-adding enzyme [Anaerolineales bacterium]